MNMNALEDVEKLRSYIVKSIIRNDHFNLQLDEPLLSSGLIDSLHLVDLSMYIEDEFGVRLSLRELNSSTFDNLKDLISLIHSKK